MDLQVFLPRSPSAYEIQIKVQYEIWKQEKEAREPQFVIENIRFAHDPLWRERFFGISTIRDVTKGNCTAVAPTIFWGAVEVLFAAGAAGPYLLKMFY